MIADRLGTSDAFRAVRGAPQRNRPASQSRASERVHPPGTQVSRAGAVRTLFRSWDTSTLHVGAVADKWREVQTGDPDFFVLGLEFNLYLVRNPGLRERVRARRHEGAQRVGRFMEQQAAAAGAELPMPVEDLANIFLITSGGFTMATLIDPELARLYEPFLELLIQGLVADPLLAPDPAD